MPKTPTLPHREYRRGARKQAKQFTTARTGRWNLGISTVVASVGAVIAGLLSWIFLHSIGWGVLFGIIGLVVAWWLVHGVIYAWNFAVAVPVARAEVFREELAAKDSALAEKTRELIDRDYELAKSEWRQQTGHQLQAHAEHLQQRTGMWHA